MRVVGVKQSVLFYKVMRFNNVFTLKFYNWNWLLYTVGWYL